MKKTETHKENATMKTKKISALCAFLDCQPTTPAPSILPFPAPGEAGPEGAQSPRAADDQPQSPRAWTKSELELIADGIVPASRRYDAEFVAAVKAKAEGGAR